VSRGRITAYLRYQTGDFLLQRAALPTLLAVAFGYLTWKTASLDWNSVFGQRFLLNTFGTICSLFFTLAPFIGVARLVADDRSNGYFRFFFSKPVSITRFYLQQWFLVGAGFVAITGLLALWLQAGTASLPIAAAMEVMGLHWILVGGIGFALTALTNHDAVILVLTYVVSALLHALKDTPRSPLPEWLRQATRLLPPTHKLGYIQDFAFANGALPMPHVWHVLGYGAACVAVGIVVLRRGSYAQ
jgi:hypothetical protein